MLSFEEARLQYEDFKIYKMPRLQKLNDYYNAKHKILRKSTRSNGKEPTRAVNNFAKYISTITTGYFIGSPITYAYTDEGNESFEEFQKIFKCNTESSNNADIALYMSIYGKGYELNYIDEESKYNFAALDPRNVIAITDGKIKPSVTDAIVFDEVFLKDDKVKVTMTIYDDSEVVEYEYIKYKSSTSNFSFEEKNRYKHNLAFCPVIEYRNNRYGKGDYEDVIDLIDAYNEAISSSIDDVKDFTDAFLKLKNLSGTTDDDIEKIKQNKVILVDGDGDADWLVKNVNDTYSENIKNRLAKDIHKFSFTPDLSDEDFAGNLSGVAIKCKFQSLEQLRQEKERWFYKGLLKRLLLINDYLSKYNKSIDLYNLEVKFKANLPINNNELIQNVNNLSSVISHKTQLSMLPFIQDVDNELDQIAEEKNLKVNPYKVRSFNKGDDIDE